MADPAIPTKKPSLQKTNLIFRDFHPNARNKPICLLRCSIEKVKSMPVIAKTAAITKKLNPINSWPKSTGDSTDCSASIRRPRRTRPASSAFRFCLNFLASSILENSSFSTLSPVRDPQRFPHISCPAFRETNPLGVPRYLSQ